MRKLSAKWPVWLTVCALVLPGFYVLYRIGNPEIFDLAELADKLIGGVGIAIIVWFVYGVACLSAPSVRDATAGKSCAPREDLPVRAGARED